MRELREQAERIGSPLVIKWARGGYDGHGVRVISAPAQAADWLADLEAGRALLVEEKVNFTRELAVLLARRPSGEIRQWDVAQTVQHEGICSVVQAPAPGLAPDLARRAQQIGASIAKRLDVTGVLAVEMFLCERSGQPQLVVNELAMRPHNSGHWTLDGAVTSQFENHLRAVLDLPLGDTGTIYPASCMVNLLGAHCPEPRQRYAQAMAAVPEAKIHYYGKEVRARRKLGHVSVCGADAQLALRRASAAVALLGAAKETR